MTQGRAVERPLTCGQEGCECIDGVCPKEMTVASINGIALHAPGERLGASKLRERAWGELLRQEAVRLGLLPNEPVPIAPTLDERAHDMIDGMLREKVPVPAPSDDECRRYYEANKTHFTQGRRVHLRHILFAVTNGVDVHALAVRAEEALLELLRRDVPPGRFAELARDLSNCPSASEGGDLGWIGPEDCAEELANELFHQKNPLHGIGLHPRLVHSRFGFHIVEVLGRKQGRQLPYEQVRERIALQLTQQARATALHQYIRVLAGQAFVEGIDLRATASPLVQ